MKIEKATQENLKELMPIFARARNFMASTGNPNQWINGYPSEELISEDIAKGHCFICRADDNHIAAAFIFIIGGDPTYRITITIPFNKIEVNEFHIVSNK